MVLLSSPIRKDSSGIALATKKGWDIPNVQKDEIPEFKAKALRQDLHKQYENFAELRSLSHTYNCVGMVFGTRRTFIDVEYVDKILRDDGYKKIEPTTVLAGDIIIYRIKSSREVCHIGIVLGRFVDKTGIIQFHVLSKWGQTGEYIHLPENVPLGYLEGTEIEYWSERFMP